MLKSFAKKIFFLQSKIVSGFLQILNKIQRINNITGPHLAARLHLISHRFKVCHYLCFLSNQFHGTSSNEIFLMVSRLFEFISTMRLVLRSPQFPDLLAKYKRIIDVSSFFSRYSRLWNLFPTHCFQAIFNIFNKLNAQSIVISSPPDY